MGLCCERMGVAVKKIVLAINVGISFVTLTQKEMYM